MQKGARLTMAPKSKHTSAPPDWPSRLLPLFQTHPATAYKSKEIARTLGVPREQYLALRKELRRLAQEGLILKLRKNQYTLAAPVAELSGVLRVNSQGYGFVAVEDGQDIFVSSKNMGLALHKDKVRVRLLAGKMGANPEGQIVGINERARTQLVGTFHHGRHYSYVAPDEIKIQKDILIHNQDAGDVRDGEKVVVTIEEWEHEQLNPVGRIVRILGYADAPGVDILSIVHGFELQPDFPAAVLQESERIEEGIPVDEYPHRLDLRQTVTFTIDPEDAQDFDDAVSLEKLENGHWRLGVHIADVGFYVTPQSLVDQEAQKRGTSVYLVDRVIPMLPEKLSNKLCSLAPESDKLCYSALLELTGHAHLVQYEFKKTVIRSHKRFTYNEAQQILDGRLQSPHSETLQEMWQLVQNLIAERKKRGSIDFESTEIKVILDQKGKPIQLQKRQRLNSHRLIEEFMLLANQTVARHVGQVLTEKLNQEVPFVYRIHEKPDRADVKELLALAQVFGIPAAAPTRLTPQYFQKLSQQFLQHPAATVLQDSLIRTMAKAKYSTENVGHFGLAYKYYTHFTSPIRRYPDLMVHRLLHAITNDASPAISRTQLESLCRLSSDNEVRAQEAERASIKMKQLEFLEAHIGEIFSGFISRIVGFGFFVTLPEFLIDGLVHVSELKDDYYVFDPKKMRLTGERRGGIYNLGDRVRVQISRIERNERLVDFVLQGKEQEKPAKPRKKR
jgi:ribonuclease R